MDQSNKIGDTSTQNISPKQPSPMFQIVGEVAWLMAKSMNHQYLFVNELEWLLFPPMALNQYHVFRNTSGHIMGVALWASVSDEVHERLNNVIPRLKPNEWNSGDHVWLIDLIAPFGQQEDMLTYLKKNIFSGRTVYVQKQMEDGSVNIVSL